MPMKKLIAGGVHALSILLIVISISLLTIGSPAGMGLSFVAQPEFVESAAFENLVSESINDIFDYTDLKDLFETNDKLDLNKVIAQAEFNGKSVSYTLDYLIKYARSKGYYLNEKNQVISGDASQQLYPDKNQINVTYRAYLPDFQATSPSDGLMTLTDLSLETLDYLAKYYALRSRYFDSASNLNFCVYYYSSGQSTIYSNAPDNSPEDMMAHGKYLYTSSDTIEVKTNLAQVPSNVIPMLQAKNPYSAGSYYFVLGINTEFPYEDYLRTAYLTYTEQRNTSIVSLIILAVGAVLAMLSLGGMVVLAGRLEGDRKKLQLVPIDRIPLELLLPMFVAGIVAARLVGETLISSADNLLGALNYGTYWSGVISFVLEYVVFLVLGLSLVRRYKGELLWENSLLKRLTDILQRYIRSAQLTTPKFFSYIMFILPNLIGGGLIVLLYARFFTRRSLLSFLTATALLVILAAIDFYTYNISSGLADAVNEQVKSERLKADLITNVSHDIKTPLTSIINYVDLLKREQIENPRVQNYIEVLDQKSHRLKTLTEDLVEASKASSGNISIEFSPLDLTELALQAVGEFEDKFRIRKLETICTVPDEPVMVMADGRRLWRVLENLLNNACKYAMEGSRIYIDVKEEENAAIFTIKNISESPLNISPEELTERFVRGDVSRTTEGSGLGLSIAKSLTTLMQGNLIITIDGDLYKAMVSFPKYTE